MNPPLEHLYEPDAPARATTQPFHSTREYSSMPATRRALAALAFLVFLVIGLFLTTSIAWFAGAFHCLSELDEPAASPPIPPWVRARLSGVDPILDGTIAHHTATVTVYGGRLADGTSRKLVLFSAGWPMRALWSWTQYDVLPSEIDIHGGYTDLPDHGAIVIDPNFKMLPEWLPHSCFYLPILPGLAIDTLLYALIALLILTSARRISRRFRAAPQGRPEDSHG